MGSVDLYVFDSSLFLQGSETDVVIDVERVRVSVHERVAVLIKRAEPCRLLRVDHTVMFKHHEHEAFQVGEIGLSGRTVIVDDLVIQLSEENAITQVPFIILRVTIVACGAEMLLEQRRVDEEGGDPVDEPAN